LPVLEVNRVSGLGKPKQASLALHRGEILGIFGLVGSGRSEMLRVVFGLDPIRSGEIVVHGVPRTRSTPTQRLTQGIGLVSENRKEEGLLLNLSIADNLTLTRLEPYTHFGMIASRSQETSTRTWMERLGVRAQGATQAIAELSGGNQQKIAIGRLLHHGADILLLDEPTRGIDVGAKAQVYRLIGELAAVGTAVIVVSSYIPELLGICDSVAVMCRGQLGASRPVAEWDQHRILSSRHRPGIERSCNHLIAVQASEHAHEQRSQPPAAPCAEAHTARLLAAFGPFIALIVLMVVLRIAVGRIVLVEPSTSA
jgi:ribose transport system ATP-binding protein